jgi:hypothetical protein
MYCGSAMIGTYIQEHASEPRMRDGIDSVRDPLDPANLTRPRGVLTEADRKFLTGRSEIEPASHSARTARRRIRERLRHAILDFSILHTQLEDRDLTQAFDEESTGSRWIRDTAPDIIGTLSKYYGEEELENIIETGMQKSLRHGGSFSKVSVDIEITGVPVEDAIERIPQEDVEDLSIPDLRDLLLNGSITDERFAELVQNRRDSQE